MWYGWSFIIAAVLMIISAIYLIKMPFPDHRAKKETAEKSSVAAVAPQANAGKLDMAIFTLYGYIGMATFYLVSQWLAQYGEFVAGIPHESAIKLLSVYTAGSLTCVFVTAAFVKEVFSSAVAMIDLSFFEKQGIVKTTYGGAYLTRGASVEPGFQLQSIQMADDKHLIGQKAAEQVEDGDTIIIDCGTTPLALAHFIFDKKIMVITNSIPVVNLLKGRKNIKLIDPPSCHRGITGVLQGLR